MADPLRDALAATTLDLGGALARRGVVTSAGDAVARAVGLEAVTSQELVAFDCGALGLAYDLAERDTGLVLLRGEADVRAGEGVRGLGRLPSIPAGPGLLGRVVDPLGRPLDDGPAPTDAPRPVFAPAPELIERKSVDQPLLTGVMVVDAAIPIGRGQRELIVGDRNVGKTSLALDLLAAQRPGDVAGVYVAVGQPISRVLGVREALRRAGALANTAIVVGDASMPPGMQYLAPYAGMAVAEALRDAVVVFDDLTKHADAYRELALLLGRPPGREAFPGDIFHVHAELLERAAARRDGGSITAFPIVETTEGDISAYVPTNLISITDGQIYLDTERFERNQRPAVDVGRSVSRIGAVAQPPPIRAAARNLRIRMARFESLEALSRVGLDLEEGTRRALARGERTRALLRQGRFSPRGVAEQALTLTALDEGLLDDLDPDRAREVVQRAARTAADFLGNPAWKEAVADLVRRARSEA
jgi:F-type H+-transporting ATPase subunit alpha